MGQKPDEWFDVVNERDEVIGRATRREVHARGLLHRAVHILVFDRAGRVFLQKRSMSKDLCPGLWDSSCSGHVDSGEDYDFSARRELGEELGLTNHPEPVRWFYLEACRETGWEFCWIYRLAHEGPFVLHPEEIETGDWFTPAEVDCQMQAEPGKFCPAWHKLWPIAAARLRAG